MEKNYKKLLDEDQLIIAKFRDQQISQEEYLESTKEISDNVVNKIKKNGFPFLNRSTIEEYIAAVVLSLHLPLDDMLHVFELFKKTDAMNYKRAHLAYFEDKIAVLQGKKQKYGTQYKIGDRGENVLLLEDAQAVDQNRLDVGLEPLDDYFRDLRSVDVVCLGEMHGSAQNAGIVESFVDAIKPAAVCFEWPIEWQKYIEENDLEALSIKFKEIKDGRVTKNHLLLISKLKDLGVPIYLIDSGGQTWNEREANMFKNVEKIISADLPLLVIVGALHARKKAFNLKNEPEIFKPFASLFVKGAKSIRIRYSEGQINNFGIVSISDAVAKKKIGSEKEKLLKSSSKYFDFEYIIDHTDAAELFN